VFEADDRLCTFRVLGFETPGLIGRGELEGQRVVRFHQTIQQHNLHTAARSRESRASIHNHPVDAT
jgi:hypothetical protein